MTNKQEKQAFIQTETRETQFRDIIKYDRDFPALFELGDLSSVEENIIFALLGELRDRYDGGEASFTYKELAQMADYTIFDKRVNKYVPRTGKAFEAKIEKLQKQMQTISYTVIKKTKEDGSAGAYDAYPLFSKFTVDHIDKRLTVQLSDEEYEPALLSEDGKVIQGAKRVKDLFNNKDWSQTKYMKLGRDFHNMLSSQYSKRLYRYLAEYRSTGFIRAKAEFFEEKVMQLTTPSLQKTKAAKINPAVKNLTELKDNNGELIFKDLICKKIRTGGRISHYEFHFKPFDIDLSRIINIDGDQINFDKSVKKLSAANNLQNILTLFYQVFEKGGPYDNPHNHRQLQSFLDNLGNELVTEALERTALDKRRGFGWTRKVLQEWTKHGYKSLEDLKTTETSHKEENTPTWSDTLKKTFSPEQQELIKSFHQLREKKNYTIDDYRKEAEYQDIFNSWGTDAYVYFDRTPHDKYHALKEKLQDSLKNI